MKKLITLSIICLLTSFTFFGQQDLPINYKAVISNDTGNLITNQTISVRFTIYEGSPTGTAVYQETLTPTTDANGMISLEIGANIALDFDDVDWFTDKHYYKVEFNIGAGFVDMGTQKFNAVPYAKYANESSYADNAGSIPFNSIQNKPTTLAGYGITDGATEINGLLDGRTINNSVFLGNNAGANDVGYQTPFITNNVGVGFYALNANTSGKRNTAVGSHALSSNQTGSGNSSYGYNTLKDNLTGHYNTANGSNSLHANTDGSGNTANGSAALGSNTTGADNTANGRFALFFNQTGNQNTVLGAFSGKNSTGSGNVFLGYNAGFNETGSNKLYIENSDSATPLIGGDFSTDIVTINGSIAIKDGTQGSNKFLKSNTSGNATWQTIQLTNLSDAIVTGSSLFLGAYSGIVSNGGYNIGIGRSSLRTTTSGHHNIGIGYSALHYTATGNNNIAIGDFAGLNAHGDGNIFLGSRAGYNETGSNKLYIENSNSTTPLIGGDFNLDIVTINGSLETTNGVTINKNSNMSDAHLALTETEGSDGARIFFKNSTETANKWTLWGRADDTDADSFFNIHHSNAGNVLVVRGNGKIGIKRDPITNTLEVNGNASKNSAGSWLANSDKRLKKDIHTIPQNEALKRILALRGVTYQWNDTKTGIERPKGTQYGFIAQELMEVFPSKVSKDNLGYYQTAYGDYDPLFVQAIKELNNKVAEIKSLKEELNTLKNRLNKIEKALKTK